MDSFSLVTLERKKEEINRQAKSVAFSYLSNIRIANSFIYDENQLAEFCIMQYRSGKTTYSDAMAQLQEQYDILYKRNVELMMGSAKIYAIAERRKEQNSTLNIILKQVGFVSGGIQAIGGYGICYASVGTACASLGTPLVLHGLENMWENGYFLALRSEPTDMPLREAYRQAAKLLGGDGRDGDIAYSIGDLALSAGSMFKAELVPNAWKLFYYIREDYIISWKTMGAAGIGSEIVGDSAVGFSLYQLINNSEQWKDLSGN
ncbi:DUF4225 domain-containing protein [Serratia fonticola]|jgi:hypothetical protein|uniref:DUF4225 domain-containing protein n=1 Tax=Serratia fonticola TaxID=47917 RepID=UPI00217962E3|nr:DUF4225 domain-containing protein [Serratia fonticola]MDK2376442.1 DUF4225 domain-containing protein [Serratia fonticola]CAI0690673.1 Uncharacterised protein [Serratia fonticola]CAI1093946.1 Uncharacterised protein [Serratia fonticola]CAI1870110.1 Uncharacterised protein [Serratia fonticola]